MVAAVVATALRGHPIRITAGQMQRSTAGCSAPEGKTSALSALRKGRAVPND